MLNRFYLLSSLVLSLILPLIKLDLFDSNINVYKVNLNPINITEVVNKTFPIDYNIILMYSYLSISLILLMNLAIKIFRLLYLYKRSEKKYVEGLNAAIINQNISPFSFFNMIFLPYDLLIINNLKNIITHEQIHSKYFHSIDNLFLEVVKTFYWFNPVIWFYRKELKAVNEFFADKKVLENDANINQYKEELFTLAFNLSGSVITNSFNSLLKRRLTMLSTKSLKERKYRFAFLIPIIFIAVLSLNFITTGSSSMIINLNYHQDSVYTEPEVMPEYPGGQKALIDYMINNIKYPEVEKKAGIQGKVLVEFVIEKDGSITNVKIKEAVHEGLDAEALRVISGMPKWKPGTAKGEPVRTEMILPIMFALK
ncbi:MAG TPA: M56 family metallopeptidase [Ignavibacteriaceae bacterium]|nr:M56 family metallopeptidase [Ignavibacteriaceae bacterium]